jgi:G3E family GTPase
MARDDLDLGRAIRPRSAAQLARGAVGTETVLAEQIAFASDIYLTKTDRIADGEVDHLVAAVHALNPAAAVSVVRFGNIRLDSVLSLPAYDVQAVRLLSRQIDAADRRRVDSDPIVSLVLDDPRPFHPGRLWDAFTTAMPRELHRSKGFTWLPSRDDQVLVWNQAAGGIGLEILGYWRSGILAHVDNDLTAEEIAGLRSTVATGDAVFGDRRTQITLIGPAGPAGAFLDLLGSCLLTPDEVDRWAAGGAFEDPWPTRRVVLTLPAETDSRG